MGSAFRFVAAVAVGLATAMACHAEAPKYGRLIWTELNRTGRWTGAGGPPEMLIATKAYHPQLSTAKNADGFGPDTGVWLKLDRNNAESVPRMHATLDHLGTGLLAGTGPGVKLVAGTGKGAVTVDGKIYAYRLNLKTGRGKTELENEVLLTPQGDKGWFFPSVTRDGKSAFLTKTTAGPQGITHELFKMDLQRPGQAPAALGGAQPLLGAYAVPSPNGEYLAWVTRNDEGSSRLAIARVSGSNQLLYQLDAGTDRRIVHPAWRGDSLAITFCSDYQADETADNWDIYAVPLSGLSATGTIKDTPAVVKLTEGGTTNNVWPSWSTDGRHIAFSRKEGTGKYDVFVQELEVNDQLTKVGTPVKVSDNSGSDSDAMWASYFQDINPPSLRVELVPTDSGISNVVALASFDETVGVAADAAGERLLGTAFFSAKGTHFNKDMKTPIGGAAQGNNASAPSSGPTTVAIKDWKRETAAPSRDGPMYLGMHVGNKIKYPNDTATKPLASPLQTLGAMATAGTYKDIQGLYVNKDARIVVKISAKDNQWRRPYPGTEESANSGDVPWVFPDGDGRAMAPGYAPPYLPLNGRDQVLAGEPGVAWWWEDDTFGVLGGVNSTEYICRFGNFEGDEEAAKPKMVYFRAIANDLWGNRTELTMPVFVYTKAMDLRVLNFDGARKDRAR
jgi:Tol biopolymer transport system component